MTVNFKNMTTGQKSVENGVENNNTTVTNPQIHVGGFQEVLIHTKRGNILRMLNNILKNVGETKQLSSKDNCERMYSVLNYLDIHYELKIHLLLDPESQHVYTGDYSDNLSFEDLYRHSNGEWYVKLRVENGEDHLWSEIIKIFPDSEWIIDQYIENTYTYMREECFNHYMGSKIMKNENGKITIQDFDLDNVKELGYTHLLHHGFLELRDMKTEIEMKEDYNSYLEVNVDMEEWIHNQKEINEKKLWYGNQSLIWINCVKNVMGMTSETINKIDSFCPYYYRMVG